MTIHPEKQVIDERIQTVVSQTATRLTQAGLSTETYVIPNSSAYAAVTEVPEAPVYCLEARIGPSHQRPGYSSYGIAQIFHPQHPSMALVMLVNRRDRDGRVDGNLPVYNVRIDHLFSEIFLPHMHSAFNGLDPSGQQRSVLIQSYNARLTLADFVPATVLSVKLVRRFKNDGQLAQIAVDFDDPLITLIARLLTPLTAFGDIHYFSRTSVPSRIQIPLRDASEQVFLINSNSDALDKGIAVAQQYLTEHYRKSGVAS